MTQCAVKMTCCTAGAFAKVPQPSSQWHNSLLPEIPVRVYCLLIWDRVAFTLVGVNADPILNDLVISLVLVPVVDVT